ncbi:MAG: hypothetical protein DMG13_07260 [Acidobacteria bacterium]|nr:MAG: hypothetical protein DMG13_07260 [Acidobacteriota bacterium]
MFGVSGDGVAVTGVRAAACAVRDRRDWRVSEGAAVVGADTESRSGNSASIREVILWTLLPGMSVNSRSLFVLKKLLEG